MSFIKYIADENHYKDVLTLVGQAKRTVWLGTADIKDLYVDDKPFLFMLASLLKTGVEVRLIPFSMMVWSVCYVRESISNSLLSTPP